MEKFELDTLIIDNLASWRGLVTFQNGRHYREWKGTGREEISLEWNRNIFLQRIS
jgi:hypothetical protein